MKFNDLPEHVKVMILVRLPSRVKPVCREWKSIFESSYFRSLNQRNRSSPWSIAYVNPGDCVLEYLGERWGFNDSPGTCLSRLLDHMKRRTRVVAIADGLVLLDESETIFKHAKFLVASPTLQQWIKIPSSPPAQYRYLGAALVTQINNNGDVLGYKVVQFELGIVASNFHFQMYSSETGNWTYHQAFHDRPIFVCRNARPISLNGYLHWICRANRVILAYDFYAKTVQEVRLIDFPDDGLFANHETCTVSCGSLVYILDTGSQVRVWRLKNYTNVPWEFLWSVRTCGRDIFGSISSFPVTMHPFDSEVMYFVGEGYDGGQRYIYLISGNMKTEEFQIQKASNQNEGLRIYGAVYFCHLVLPHRLGSIPCPPGCSLVTASAPQA